MLSLAFVLIACFIFIMLMSFTDNAESSNAVAWRFEIDDEEEDDLIEELFLEEEDEDEYE